MLTFITYLHKEKGFSAASIRTFLSGLAHFFKLYLGEDPTKSDPINKLLKNYGRCAKVDLRKPIDKHLVKKLIERNGELEQDQFYADAFRILYTLFYTLALRISEVTNHAGKTKHAIAAQDIKIFQHDNQIHITLRSYKHGQTPKTFILPV